MIYSLLDFLRYVILITSNLLVPESLQNNTVLPYGKQPLYISHRLHHWYRCSGLVMWYL